ncbi:hypothetical protein D3C75_1082750 [compost metagenome]
MTQDQQRPFSREHTDAQIGILSNLLAPDPGGIDHHLSMNIVLLCGLVIENAHARHAIAST